MPAGTDLATDTLAGRSLADFGQSLAQTGEYLARAETYGAQRLHAQDVTDGTRGSQVWTQRFQPAYAERAKGDYRTFPEDIVKTGKTLFDQVALERNLSPQAKAFMREKVESALNIAQQKALEVRDGRMQQDALFAVTTEVQRAQELGAEAQTEGELQVVLGGLGGTLHQMVTSGLQHGDVAGSIYRKTEDLVRTDRAVRFARKDPVATFYELQDMAAGKPARSEALQFLPAHLINPVTEQVVQQIAQQAGVQDRQDRHTKALRATEQSKNAITLRSKLVAITPIPANAAAIEPVIQEIIKAGPDGLVDENSYAALTTLATGWRETASKPPQQYDDDTVKHGLTLYMMAVTTPAEFNQVRESIFANEAKLKPETVQHMLQTVDSRENALSPFNLDSVRRGRNMITEYMVPGATLPGMPSIQLKNEESQLLRDAYIAYDSKVEAIGEPRQLNMEATQIANAVIDRYLVPYLGPQEVKKLHKVLHRWAR
jgi:hypothetical protein